MKKKFMLCGIASLIAMGTVGCSFGGETEVDQFLPEDDPTSEVTIKFWHCLGQDKRNNLNKVVTAFNTEYAGKYKVELVDLAGDYDSLHTSVKTKLASGEVPALTMGYPDSFAEYITKSTKTSSILRLTNFINDKNFGYTKAELDDFVPGYFAEGSGYQFEGVWSMPMYKSTEVMYYNEDLFEGANAANDAKFADDDDYWDLKEAFIQSPYNDREEERAAFKSFLNENGGYIYTVPSTWDEMITLGRKMIKDRKDNNVVGTFYPIGYDSDANMMITQMKQRDIPYTSNSEESKTDSSKHFLFKNDQAKAFLTEIKGNIDEGVLLTKGRLDGKTYTNQYFTRGELAMTIGSTGGSSYNVSSNFSVKLAPVPTVSAEKKVYIQQGPSICFFDNEKPYVHKGAWLFYKKLAEPTTNAALALENSYDPVRISSYDTEEYSTWLSKAGQGLKYDIPAITATLKDYYYTSETFIGSGTARTEIGNLIKYVCNNNYTVDQAFDLAYNKCIAAA